MCKCLRETLVGNAFLVAYEVYFMYTVQEFCEWLLHIHSAFVYMYMCAVATCDCGAFYSIWFVPSFDPFSTDVLDQFGLNFFPKNQNISFSKFSIFVLDLFFFFFKYWKYFFLKDPTDSVKNVTMLYMEFFGCMRRRTNELHTY